MQRVVIDGEEIWYSPGVVMGFEFLHCKGDDVSEISQVRCLGCRLNQFARESCRRCGRTLPRVAFDIAEMTEATVLPTLAAVESALIAEALRRTRGHKVLAAKMIGIGKTTLYRKIRGAD